MYSDMLKSSIMSLAVLISVVSIENQLTKNHAISPASPVWRRAALGLYCAVAGCFLAICGFYFQGMPVDFRHIMLVYAGVTGGPVSSFVTAAGMFALKSFFFSEADWLFVTLALYLLPALVSGAAARHRLSYDLKWLAGVLSSAFAVCGAALLYKIDSAALYAANYALIALLLSFVTFKYCKLLGDFNHIYRKLKIDASTDALTGLDNVRGFDYRYNIALAEATETKKPIAFMFIDVDYFKQVNDCFGHSEGDRVLVQIARRLRESCRKNDIIARIGGEEFAVVMPSCGIKQAYEAAQRIRQNFESEKIYLSNGDSIKISLSIGVAAYPDVTRDPNALRDLADMAVSVAKQSGRNRVVMYSPIIEQPAVVE